jgi:hypothetical protein
LAQDAEKLVGGVQSDVRRQVTERLKELKPLVDEYHQLEAMVQKLGDGDGAAPSSRRSGRRRRSSHDSNGRRRGRPRGSGTRSAQALALSKPSPGLTIPEMGKEMSITRNYLYRVLPELAKHGKVQKARRRQSRSVAQRRPAPAIRETQGRGRLLSWGEQ